MPWKITNTVLDPSKAMLHRTAARLSTEPLVCGRVLRIRETMTVSDDVYAAGKAHIDVLIGQGAISAEQIGGAPKPKKAAAPAPEPEPAPEPTPEPPPAEPEPEPEPEPASSDDEEDTSPSTSSGKRRRKKGKE